MTLLAPPTLVGLARIEFTTSISAPLVMLSVPEVPDAPRPPLATPRKTVSFTNTRPPMALRVPTPIFEPADGLITDVKLSNLELPADPGAGGQSAAGGAAAAAVAGARPTYMTATFALAVPSEKHCSITGRRRAIGRAVADAPNLHVWPAEPGESGSGCKARYDPFETRVELNERSIHFLPPGDDGVGVDLVHLAQIQSAIVAGVIEGVAHHQGPVSGFVVGFAVGGLEPGRDGVVPREIDDAEGRLLPGTPTQKLLTVAVKVAKCDRSSVAVSEAAPPIVTQTLPFGSLTFKVPAPLPD